MNATFIETLIAILVLAANIGVVGVLLGNAVWYILERGDS